MGNFLVVQWLRLGIFMAMAWIRSLVGKLGNHKLHDMAKNK